MVPSRQTALPPWGDDGAAAVHGADGLLLHLEEVLHPELVQDVLEQQALPLLDHQVGVQKAVAQGFGQKNAHSALARAGHADENDVVQSVILPLYRLISGISLTQKPGKRKGKCTPSRIMLIV